MSASFVIPPPPQAAIAVAGDSNLSGAPMVRRAQLSRAHPQMGNDERAPPFFFAKHADMVGRRRHDS